MTSNLKSYPSYKPSGVAWLGDVPAHWEVRRLKQVCSRSSLYGANIAATYYQETGVRFLRTTDITDEGELREGGVFLPQELVGNYVLEDGDILISRSGTVGRSFLYQSHLHELCAYAGYLVRFVPDISVLPKYIFLFTKTQAFEGFVRTMSISSTIENVNADKYANAHLPIPPLAEQAAIVRYLDHTDGRIVRYLHSRERLIELLKEYRQAVIHESVTRGLDPDVPLKPSGVAWLGDVPAHWETRRLRHAVNMRVSNVDKHSKDDELPVRLCNYVDVYKNDRITESMPFMRATAKANEIDRFRLEPGDVLITKDSEVWNDIGVPAFVEYSAKDLVCGYHLALLRPLRTVLNGAYLFYSLQSSAIAYQFHIAANGVTRYGLSHHAIKSALLPIPPLAEQAAIAAYLDKQTAAIDAAMARARREIDLLSEYRTRLIADVVTGQVDVREVAGLPVGRMRHKTARAEYATD